MRKVKFLTLAMAALAFAACSNDDTIDNSSENGGKAGGKAWLALQINKSTGNTRNLNNPEKENGTSDETDISSAKVILFKYTGSGAAPLAQDAPTDFLVVQVEDLTGAEVGTPTQGGSGSAAPSKAFKVSGDAEYILFIANPPANFPTISANVHTFAYVNSALSDAATDHTTPAIATNQKFMMTNAKGDLEPSTSATDPALTPVATYDTETAAQAAPAALTVDRVAAKVRVNSGSLASSLFDFSDTGWILNVTNKKYFPVSKRTKTQEELTNGNYIWSDPYKLGSYRVDPNYNNTADGSAWVDATPAASQTAYNAHYNYYTEAAQPAAWKTSGNTQYCLENTQVAADNLHAYTTHVLFKARVNPKTYEMPDKSLTPAASTAHDWIKIGSGFYTSATLIEWIKAQLEAGETGLADAFNIYLKGIYDADNTSGINVVTIDITNAGTIATTVTDFTTMLANLAAYANSAATYGVVSYYKAGLNYYKIAIKHDDYDTGLNQLGEFGVVRNSVYDINLNNILKPGFPTIPDPDDTPDEEKDLYLSVQIEINPWTWYTQENDL